jgi:DNA processing protein
LAYGIDALAHEIALTNHAPTVAVFGTGLDLVYPAGHYNLAERIVSGDGALVSEFPLTSGPERHHFPQRNRIISGLSRAVLLVEARVKSGALVTAKFAVDQNRDLYVVPGDIDRETAAGPLSWLRLGATPVMTAADIINSFPHASNPAPITVKKLTSADPTEQTLLEILSTAESLHIDEIVEQCKLDASVVTAVLALLEIRGVIRHLGGMRYTAVT